MTGSHDDEVTAIRERAGHAPTPEQVQAMADAAMARGSADMSPEEIRALGRQAVSQAHQVAVLLGRLAALTEARS